MNFLDAFKALDALNEDTYSLDSEGIKKLKEFQDTDDLTDEVTVIDVDAETEEDLSDSYVGKVILDCSVCHSKLYKSKDEINIDEEQQLANVGEECPYCYTSDGFKVIGEVSPFNSETEVEVEETTTDDEQIDEPELVENLNESLSNEAEEVIAEDNLEEATALADRPGTIAHALKDSMNDLATISNVGEMKQKVIDVVKASDVSDKEKSRAIAIFMKPKSATALLSTIGTFMTGIKAESLNESMRGDKLRLNAEILDVLGMDGYDVDSDDVISLADAATDLAFEEYLMDTEKSLEQIAKDWLQATKENYPEDLEALTKLDESILEESLSENADAVKAVATKRYKGIAYDEMSDGTFRLIDSRGFRKPTVYKNLETVKGIIDKELKEGLTTSTDVEKAKKPSEYTNIEPDSKDLDFIEYAEAHPADENDNLFENHKSIKESVNSVNVETDEDIINVATDDNGKVTITTEPIENQSKDSDDEIIVPVSDETEAEILSNDNSESDISDIDNADKIDSEVEVDIDEFDEESFDNLGESYFKKIYENVNSFRTSSVKKSDTSLIVEGILTIDGKSKKTNFIFESKDINRSGRVRFIGENKEVTNGCKAFTLRGKVQDNKFICESLNYNYKVTDEGKSRRIYGIVTRKD